MSLCQLLNHLNLSFQLSPGYLWSRSVYENLSTIQCCINHRIVWYPSFLTNLISYCGVLIINNKNSYRNSNFASNLLYRLWKPKLTNFSFIFPCWKTSGLIVIISISCNSLTSYSYYFILIKYNSCIIQSSFMHYRASNLAHNLLSDTRF